MKRIVSLVIAMFIMALIFQFSINFFIIKRNYNYSLKTDNNTYMIQEKYNRKGKTNMYSFIITEDNTNKYVYNYEGDLNKQSKVIKNIISYKKGDVSCIAPVLRNDYIDSIMCKKNGNLVSYTYLKQIGYSDIDNFLNTLTKTGYKVNLDYKDINVNSTDFERISYFTDIDPNLYFTIWNYNSLYIVNGENTKNELIMDKDEYENENSILIDKYYVAFSNDGYFNSFYILNIKDGGQFKLTMDNDESLSPNFYFNGSYKNCLYITDIDKKQQYILDPKHENIKKIDTPKYFDGKVLNTVDIGALTSEKLYFKKYDIPDILISKYGNDIKYTNNNYYFLENGNVYQIIGNNYDDKILLFSFPDFKELKVLKGNIYGISNGTVYMYNNKIGLKKVLYNRELLYNSSNIYDVYQK